MIKIDTENSIPPEGYEFTGDYRAPVEGEFWLYEWDGSQLVGENPPHSDSSSFWPILRKVEKKRWRADVGGKYWHCACFDGCKWVACSQYEDGFSIDDQRYEFGDYWKTKEEAEKYLEACKKIAMEMHENE